MNKTRTTRSNFLMGRAYNMLIILAFHLLVIAFALRQDDAEI